MESEDALVSYAMRDEDFLKSSCSQQTVQPQRDGFFKNYYSIIRNKVNDLSLQYFRQLTTDEDRVSFAWNLDDIHQFPITNMRKRKDAQLSEQKRNEGNKLFGKEKYEEAKHLYTLSVLLAPTPDSGSEESTLSLALGNRAACWLHLKKPNYCIEDVEESLKMGYPKKLHYKAYDRKGTALCQMDRKAEAVEAYSKALKALTQAGLENKQKHRWERELGEKRQAVKSMIQKKTNIQMKGNQKEPAAPALSYGVNKKFPTASAAIDVWEAENEGRYGVAVNPVKAGDTLVVEKPYVACLLAERYGSFCMQCLKRLQSPYPCFWCVRVAFCSSVCRKVACSSHHKWECPLLDLLFGSGMSITCYMALRIITQKGLRFFTDQKEVLHQLRNISSGVFLLGAKESYDPNNYLSVYNLVTHSEKRSADDFLHRTVMSVFLLRCLRSIGFFTSDSPIEIDTEKSTKFCDLSDDELLIGELLLRHLQILQFNAHEVSECQMKGKDLFKDVKSLFVGAGLYPTVAFFNHNCEPGIVRYFLGDTIIVKSIKTLKQGDMIAENYGPTVARLPLRERQKQLMSRYWFECGCTACKEDWPTFPNLEPDHIKLKCSECGHILGKPEELGLNPIITCVKCDGKTNFLKSLKALENSEQIFKKGMNHMLEGEAEKAIEHFLNLLDTLHRVVASPHKDITLTEEATWKCMLSLGSTNYVSPNNETKSK